MSQFVRNLSSQIRLIYGSRKLYCDGYAKGSRQDHDPFNEFAIVSRFSEKQVISFILFQRRVKFHQSVSTNTDDTPCF